MYQKLAKHTLDLGLQYGSWSKNFEIVSMAVALIVFDKVEKFQSPTLTLAAMGEKNLTVRASDPPPVLIGLNRLVLFPTLRNRLGCCPL